MYILVPVLPYTTYYMRYGTTCGTGYGVYVPHRTVITIYPLYIS